MQTPKNIIITSYYFLPENTPRAFRTFELAREFSKKGHNVTLFIPDYDFNYGEIERRFNLKIHKVNSGFFLNRNHKRRYLGTQGSSSSNNSGFGKLLKKHIKKIVNYFIGDTTLEYSVELWRALLKHGTESDLVVSVGLPVSVHLGVAWAVNYGINLRAAKIADYGDPYYFNEVSKLCFYHKYLEDYFLKRFDYISIPTEKAIESYKYYKPEDKIKIIPQGFDFSETNKYEYSKNNKPSFAYAGLFYKIRNPRMMLDYLCDIKNDFNFFIYTDINHAETNECLTPYLDRLKNKLIINKLIPRTECIKELSKMDFLVNVGNLTSNQIPSKLIDYSLSGRPIFSFQPDNFESEVFTDFLNGDFSNQLKVNISEYDIRLVADKFLGLCNN